jgi:RimJ/RimL family protein N-acetyltransferase
VIVTERLEIVPATFDTTRAALDGSRALGAALGADVPASWPPEYFDEPALRFTIDRLSEGPGQAGWWLHFVLAREADDRRVLIGSAGFKGPPSADGTVEVGYAIVADRQRRGYGSETTRGLVEHAFAVPAVRRVISETLPDLAASIGVLRKCGFRLVGEGSEPGVIRFELIRAEHTKGQDHARARN